MPTNKIVLRTKEEFMADYVPVYRPIYPLFMGKSQAWSEEVGKIDFRRVQAVGDIRGHRLSPKDTIMQSIQVNEAKKTFKKYFFGNQFQLSHMQDQQGVEDVVAQVLDEHQKQMDELFLLGEGSSASTMLNNGLYWSNDPNYVLETSTEIAAGDTRLYDMHNKVIANATKAKKVAGQKVVLFYGDSVLPLFNSLYTSAVKPFKVALQEVLGSDFSLAEIPADVTPASANGWIIANLDQVKTHFVTLPALDDQGSNDEKKYFWFNFIMGSMMLEVLASGAVIRQPATLAVAQG